jgi:DNA-binding transcriptional ArsR family regulator
VTSTAVARRTARVASDDLASFFQGLADPIRVEILTFLLDGPKTAGEIVRHIGRAQPTVSSHLTCLRFCGYVEARREGRNVRYEIVDRRVRVLMNTGERYLRENADRIMACQVIAAEQERP